MQIRGIIFNDCSSAPVPKIIAKRFTRQLKTDNNSIEPIPTDNERQSMGKDL